MNEEVRNKKF